MRTTFLNVLPRKLRCVTLAALCVCFTAVSFAAEWVEFQPPMMDDVTVDPLRFTQQGEPFDLSDPMFKPLEHGQTCKAKRSDKTTKDKLVVDYEFTGRDGLEYLDIGSKIKIDKPGFSIGGVFKTDLPKAGAIRVRLRDPSGEIHQHTLGYPKGTPIFAKIETSPETPWGGDGDRKLQFPCEIISILLDRPEAGFKGKGTLEITNLALYESVELRDALKIEFAADSPPGLLFEGPGTLKFRLTPKNLKEGEILLALPNALQTGYDSKLTFMFDKEEKGISFIDEKRTKINGNVVIEKQEQLIKEAAEKRKKEEKEDFFAPIGDAIGAWMVLITVPQEGAIYEIPITAPGAARIVILPVIFCDRKEIPALPVSFSFGSIKPDTPLDERLGVCTHYQQGWNTNSLDFVAKAGFGMIRDEMCWGNVEPQKGVLAVPNYATYIDKTREKKIEPLVILDYSNRFYDDNGFPHSDEAVAGFANYGKFLAEQFKERIKYFEVWNEWTGGCGMRHAMDRKTNTPENYVKMLKATYEAVKAVNPEAYIIGGGGDHSSYHLKAIEAMFEAGALKYCDAFSVHPYRQPRTPEESNLVEEVVHVAELMKKYGVEKPKLWLTEIGWPTPKKHPANDAELFQAAMVVRSAVPLLATGVVEKYIWYDMKNDGVDRIDQEHNFGLIRHDKLGLQVKPAFVAFAVMSRNTAGRSIIKDEALSKDGVYAYRLTKDGEPDHLVLWVEHGEKTVQFPKDFAASLVLNLFGTPLQFSSKSITLTDEPIWMVLK